MQSRCGRRAPDVVSGRGEAYAPQEQRRQLSLSSHDPREVLGLGAATKLDWLEITWPKPSGKKERFTDLPVDQYITITEKA